MTAADAALMVQAIPAGNRPQPPRERHSFMGVSFGASVMGLWFMDAPIIRNLDGAR